MSQRDAILFLDTRALPGERTAEIKAALEMDVDLYIATPTPEAFRSYGCAGVIDTKLGDYAAAERTILGYFSERAVELAGIVPWKDLEVELAARMSRHLGLHGSDLAAAKRARDKAETRLALDAVPGANPAYAIIRNEADLRAGLARTGLPALLKPAGNSGSRGIFRIDSSNSPAAIYDQFRKYNTPDKGDMFRFYGDHALLEQIVVGSEHSVSGLVGGGRVVINAIIDKEFDRTIPIQYQNITPSLLPPETQHEVAELVRRCVEVIGIDWCGFHADVMVTADGPKILEIGGRLGGEFINSHLVPYSRHPFSPYQAAIGLACGRLPARFEDQLHRAGRRAGARVLMPPTTGQIAQVRGLEQIWRRPETRFMQLASGAGDVMALPHERFKAYEIAYVIAECALSDDIGRVLDDIAGCVSVDMVANRAGRAA